MMTSKRGPSAGSCWANWAWKPLLTDNQAILRGKCKRSTHVTPSEVVKLLKTLSVEERNAFLANLND